jgi:hypothetical protein
MENLETKAVSTSIPPRRWPLFLMGILLFLLGPAVYAVQIRLKYLGMPWYVLALATLGVLLMVVSVWQRRGVWRSVGVALFVLVCAFEWLMVLVGTGAPHYRGPAQPGRQVPVFATTLADGKAFTDTDLKNGSAAVLLFFRGRW